MERGIVLTHELVKFDFLGVLPPLSPVLVVGSEVVACNRDVADWRVEPDIEDLVLIVVSWDRSSPLQVSGDASAMEALFEKFLGEEFGVVAPFSLDRLLFNPLGQIFAIAVYVGVEDAAQILSISSFSILSDFLSSSSSSSSIRFRSSSESISSTLPSLILILSGISPLSCISKASTG